MSASNPDAVLDRVLTRIVSSGNQKAQGGRSPAGGISSVLQRDGGSARGTFGVDKRRAGNSAKFYANYRLTNPAFGSSSARDSSLAGTTVIPQFVFSKSILRVPPSLGLQLPSATTAGAASAASGASAAGAKTSALILRQQQPHRHASPQPHLRAPRCSSPPPDFTGATSRRRSSPGDPRGGGRGAYDGGASPRNGRAASSGRGLISGSPRGLPSGRGGGTCRSRSSPRERVLPDGAGGGSFNDGGTLGLLSSMYGGSAAAAAGADGDAGVPGNPPARGGSGGGRNANTITRAAALRALKQQRSTTPDIIAELRAVASSKAVLSEGPSRDTTCQPGAFICKAQGPATAGSAVPPQQHPDGGRVGGAPANAGAGAAGGAQPCGILRGHHSVPAQGPGRIADTSPHPPAHPPMLQLSHPAQVRAPMNAQQLRSQQPPAEAGREPTPATGPEAAGACGDGGGSKPSARLPESATSATATSRDAREFWAIDQEPSFRSPSPQRSRSRVGSAAPPATVGSGDFGFGFPSANGVAAAAGPTVAVATVAQRQQRAMRQHLQRQSSPSPGRRRGPGPAAARVAGSPQHQQQPPQQHHLDRVASLDGGWNSEAVLAAQSRIRRLEEQVISLSAQVTELQASHADLEFQLEEEQQQQHAARAGAAGAAGGGTGVSPRTTEDELQQQLQQQHEREQRLTEQVRQLTERLQAREVELEEQVTRARTVNETLAKQNRALYGTLEETLSAAEHAAQELKQLQVTHTQLQESHEAAQKEVSQLKEDLDLRERALSAVQAEFSALRRRHEEVTAAAEAARRDGALRDGRLRREVDAATQESAALAAQLAKLQREHQQLHCRKGEKDRQLAALAKRADAQQEQLAAAERLAQEQAALVRELESRATLLRNRNAALDRAVAIEKEARQAAQEQVRQMEEEIALLVSIVRQSDPNLEALSRYKRDPAAAAAMAAAAAAAAAAALLQASPSPTRGFGDGGDNELEAADGDDYGRRGGAGGGAAGPGKGAGGGPPPPAYSSRGGNGGRRQHYGCGHSVLTITAGASEVWSELPQGPATGPRPAAHLPLNFSIPGSAPLSVRAPPPGSQPLSQRDRNRKDAPAPEAAFAPADAAAILQPSPRATASDSPTLAATTRPRDTNSRDNSPFAMSYPAKHNMTGGVFLDLGGSRGGAHPSASPRGYVSPVVLGRSQSAGGGGDGVSPRCAQGQGGRLAATSGGGGPRSARTPTGRRAQSAGVRRRRVSDSGCKPIDESGASGKHLAATWSAGDGGAAKAIGPGWRGVGGRPEPRRSTTPPGTSVMRRARDGSQVPPAAPTMATAVSYMVGPAAATVAEPAAARGTAWAGQSTAAPAAAAVVATSVHAAAAAAPDSGAYSPPSSSPMVAAPLLEAVMCEIDRGNRVLWAKPRRGSKSASSGAGGAGGGHNLQELSYAAMHAAQRALATSALTTSAPSPLSAVVAATAAASGGRNHNRSRSCSAMEWVRPLAASRSCLTRRARTPEPKTAAAWLKHAEDSASTAEVVFGSARKCFPTPHSEISSNGRGSYKLGPPPLPAAAGPCGGPAAGGGSPVVSPRALLASGPCSGAVAELAALLQQHQPAPGPRAWVAGGHAAQLPAGAVSRLNPHQEEDEEELARLVDLDAECEAGPLGGGRGPAKRSRVFVREGGGPDDNKFEDAGGDGGVGEEWDLGLDENGKAGMASPVKLLCHMQRPPPRPSPAASRIGDGDAHHGGPQSPADLGGEDVAAAGCGASNRSSPCLAATRRIVHGSPLGRASSIIRASYAFDSPLHQQQRQQSPGGARPAAPAGGTITGGGDNGADDEDALGTVLRSLKQRQVQLMQQLTVGCSAPSDGVATLSSSGSPARKQQQLLRTAQGSPDVASFTFANPKPHLPSSPGAIAGGQADDGANAGSPAGKLGPNAKATVAAQGGHQRQTRRRGVSFADEVLRSSSEELLSGSLPLLPQQQQGQDGPREAPPPAPPAPQPQPPRSPYRPSVAAAAAAAVAAGAGVGGPLTALLDQLENAGDAWCGAGARYPDDPDAAAAASEAATSPQQPFSAAPPADDAAPLSHFSLADALKVAVERQQEPERLSRADEGPRADFDLVAADRDGGAEAGGHGCFAADDDEVFEEVDEEQQDGPEDGGGQEDRDAPPGAAGSRRPDLPRLRLSGPDATAIDKETFGAGDEGLDSSAAAAPSSPQPRDERSIGGSEPYADEDYGADADGGCPISRLGVTLYDNIAYDARTVSDGSARTDDLSGGDAAPSRRLSPLSQQQQSHNLQQWHSSTAGPVICVPTSLAGGNAESAVQLATVHLDPFSPSSSRPQSAALQPRHSGGAGVLGDGFVDSAPTAAASNDNASTLPSTASQPASLEAVFHSYRGADFAGGQVEEQGAAAVAAEANTNAEQAAALAPLPQEQQQHHAEDFLAAGPVTPLQAAAALGHGGGGAAGPPSSSSLALSASALSASSQQSGLASMSTGGGVGGSGSCALPRSAGAPLGAALGSWWLGRAEPTLLDRQFQQHSHNGLLSMTRTSLGQVSAAAASSGVVSISSGGESSGGGAGSSSGGGAGSSGGGSGGSSGGHDWLQRQRPQSPSVKPLSLAEVLRRPANSSAR